MPEPGWLPDPSWPPPPEGWQFWVSDTSERSASSSSAPSASGAAGAGVTFGTTNPGPQWSPRPAAEARTAIGRGTQLAQIFGWGGLGAVVLLGAATGGFSGAAMFFGLYSAVVGIIALARGRVGWARLGTRAAGGAACGIAFVAVIASALTAPSTAATGDPKAAGVAPAAGPSRTPTPTPTTSRPTPVETTVSLVEQAIAGAGPETTLAVLGVIPVKAQAALDGYDRSAFGEAWTDTDRNGCDQRNDILRRDLVDKTLKAGTNGCAVVKGTLRDPYTGTSITFNRTSSTTSAIQIDHVVSLGNAWASGASEWTAAKRAAFANDPLNLLAVSATANQSKQSDDAAAWLPPDERYRCAYVSRQLAVKKKYGAWITAGERTAMAEVLMACPAARLPVARVIPLGGAPVDSPPPTRTSRPRVPKPTTAPKPTSEAPRPQRGVHPGAFCSPEGALGYTSKGTLMRCSTKPGDSRARWRRA